MILFKLDISSTSMKQRIIFCFISSPVWYWYNKNRKVDNSNVFMRLLNIYVIDLITFNGRLLYKIVSKINTIHSLNKEIRTRIMKVKRRWSDYRVSCLMSSYSLTELSIGVRYHIIIIHWFLFIHRIIITWLIITSILIILPFNQAGSENGTVSV